MSSTITTRRVAAAVRTNPGPTLFVLFEERYSSNVRPHTPEWECVGLGYLPAVLERIFSLASSCEGGMLRARSARLTPEGYIGTWLKELTNPLVMQDTAVRLCVENSWFSPLTAATLPAAVNLLTQAGRDALAAELRDTQSVTLDLAHDTDAMLGLQEKLELSPGRLVHRYAMPSRHGLRDQTLGYHPAPGRAAIQVPTAMKLGRDVRLLQDPDGTWRCGGWQYAIVADHVLHLWQTELACPGHHRKRIALFRNALDYAPDTPDGIEVEVDATKASEDFQLKRIEELRPHQIVTTDAPTTIFRVPVNKETFFGLCFLPRDCARWLIPDQPQPLQMGQAALAI